MRRAFVWMLAVAAVSATAVVGLSRSEAADKDEFADLIDKPAPDFKGDFAVNGKPGKLSDLKGKVVLVDFWAVWCGPCVRTFPHLRDWNEKYKDKGLEIVGVTGYYEKFGFDKDAGKLLGNQKLSKDEEQDMLKAFAAHHKLAYRLTTLPKDDREQVYKDYKVKGIPQAVLIDRKGNVRLVKVGADPKNAEELEEMIEELLKEKS